MSEGTSTSGTGVGTVRLVAFDTPDPKASAAFWQELTSAGTFDEDDDGWTGVTTPDGWRLGFQPAPDLVRPEWPGQEHPQQVHVDLQVADVAAATQRAVSLGATLLAENERWNTLADPVGHTFDLCVSEDS